LDPAGFACRFLLFCCFWCVYLSVIPHHPRS
jgi:hypothetical protein